MTDIHRHRREQRVLALAAALALGLAACGAGDSPSSDPGPGSASAPPADAEQSASALPSSEREGTSGEEDDTGASATATEPEPGTGPLEVTLAATGDILSHHTVNRSANAYAGGGEGDYDYTPMFADVAPILSAADLALCHLETPLSPDNTALSVPDTLIFNSPFQLADALAEAGVDGCDFASNHTMDHGIQGVADTEAVLRERGMGYAGPAAQEERAGVAEVYEVEVAGGTARVAHLAYTYTYPNDGSPTTSIPGEAPWLAQASWPVLGSAGILEQAQAAREAGADFVVLSLHWGQEYQSAPTPDQLDLASDLLGSDDVDLILGTHVHVIQPCEQIGGKHVLYGLGNFLSNQSPQTNVNLSAPTQEGMVALVDLQRDAEGVVTSTLRYQPTRVEISPEVVPSHLIRPVGPQTYPETWERTTSTVDQLGGCDARPLEP